MRERQGHDGGGVPCQYPDLPDQSILAIERHFPKDSDIITTSRREHSARRRKRQTVDKILVPPLAI